MNNESLIIDNQIKQTDTDPIIIGYPTFFKHLDSEHQLNDTTVYSDGFGRIEVSYTYAQTKYLVSRRHGFNENPLLLKVLENSDVEYITLSTEYHGPENEWEGNEFDSYGWMFFAIPVVMLITIFIQAVVISRLTSK